ncbi:MAG: tRNA lysidine(34) synthetase TilS [Chitinophagaceae bacterium]|nr:tRNA lysidine(34) synthetase TilS [Chitinophagaceae bacterium]
MDMLQKFQLFISKQNLFPKDAYLLIAVSGGVDSIVLTDLCYKAGYKFTIAHCNFQLRGGESDADEIFVRSLGEKYKVEVLVKKFETEEYAAANKLSIQEAARALRYTWFEELMNRQTPSSDELNERRSLSRPTRASDVACLLTAHHADDNIETLLMNFFRGTGLHGLTGIPVANGHVKRPLLSFTKQELLAYAQEHQLKFREDASNRSSKYTRNFFRNELIPAISKVYPQVNENLQDNINRFKEIEQLYQLSTQKLIQKLCKQKGAELHIPVKQLMEYKNRALIYEIIHPFGFSEKQIDEVQKLADSDSGKYMDAASMKFRLIKHRHWFIIAPVISTVAQTIVIEKSNQEVDYESGQLTIEKLSINNHQLSTSQTIATMDASKIQFPLLLRKYKQGDYFYPLGMKKKKKVARFLIDQKLSKTDKEKIWVLESNQRIVWVVGQRIDDRFKITPSTKAVLKINLISG